MLLRHFSIGYERHECDYEKKECPTASPGSLPYIFIPLYHVSLAYRLIPEAFWSIFSVEIKKACSMDFHTVFMSLCVGITIQNMTHSGLEIPNDKEDNTDMHRVKKMKLINKVPPPPIHLWFFCLIHISLMHAKQIFITNVIFPWCQQSLCEIYARHYQNNNFGLLLVRDTKLEKILNPLHFKYGSTSWWNVLDWRCCIVKV